MATATLNSTAQPSSLNARLQKRHVPSRSSPLACVGSTPVNRNIASDGTAPSSAAQRAQCFPTSRPIRPFASIASKAATKPIKTFELPEAFKSGCFMLNLTQAEFSRQE